MLNSKSHIPRICIVVASQLPVPAVKGGAVEAMVQAIIDENEKKHSLDITLLTISDEEANNLRKVYQYTHFVILPEYKRMNRFYWKIVGLVRKFLKKELLGPLQGFAARRYIVKHAKDFDLIIDELSPDILSSRRIVMERDKMVYHIHGEGAPYRYANSRVRHLIAVSSFIKENWCEKSGWDPNNAHVLYNCINLERFQASVSQEEIDKRKNQMGIQKGSYVIVYVGRIAEEKGVLELIEAAELLQEEHYKICLILIGSASFAVKSNTAYEKDVKYKIKQSKVKIVHTGFLPNQEIYKWQKIADVQVVPSKGNEAAGLVVVEAQAAGLPVIATEKGGIPEYLCQEGGLLIKADERLSENIKEAVKQMIANPEMASDMRQKGKKYAGQFSASRYYEDFMKIIENLLNK